MSEWRSLVERARRFNPTVADALLGAFLLVISLPQLFVEDPTYRHLGITFRAGSLIGVLLLAAETLPLTWRRRYPRSVLAAMTASAFVLLVAGFRPTVADLGLVIAVYSVAGHSSRRQAAIAGLAFLVALAALKDRRPQVPTGPDRAAAVHRQLRQLRVRLVPRRAAAQPPRAHRQAGGAEPPARGGA
jgi:hypothetical protein